MITGESEPVNSTVLSVDDNPLESRNIIFNGSLVVGGGCLAVVIRTGDDTLMGSIVGLTGDTVRVKSTLKVDVEYFVFRLAIMSILLATVVFVVSCARGVPPITALIQGFVIVIVANVPQGLPASITAALYIVAGRMGNHNVFVKKLDIIETLGSCSVICTDKTGTLTENRMSVSHLWVMDSALSAGECGRE